MGGSVATLFSSRERSKQIRLRYCLAAWGGSPMGAPRAGSEPGVGGSNPSRRARLFRSIPGSWFTDHSGDMVDTFSGANGLGAGSTRPSSRSKKPRS